MRRIALVNQKGGCGKTTTAINLAAALSMQNKRVLVVDMDPQGHATIGLGVKGERLQKTVYEALSLSCEDTTLSDVIVNIRGSLDLAPCNVVLSALEQELAGKNGREEFLDEALTSLGGCYDFVLIDCPPSIGLLTFNALRACDEAIVPIELSYFSLHGLSRLIETTELLEKRLNHRIDVGVLVCLYDQRNAFSRELIDQVRVHFGEAVFDTVIRRCIRVKEAASSGSPVVDLGRRCSAAKDYAALAGEVMMEEKHKEVDHALTSDTDLPASDGRFVTLQCRAPGAQWVFVAGDFSQWSAIEMTTQNGDDVWSAHLELPPGEYQYRFIVDGEWRVDDSNPLRLDNPYGGENSLIVLHEQHQSLPVEAAQRE